MVLLLFLFLIALPIPLLIRRESASCTALFTIILHYARQTDCGSNSRMLISSLLFSRVRIPTFSGIYKFMRPSREFLRLLLNSCTPGFLHSRPSRGDELFIKHTFVQDCPACACNDYKVGIRKVCVHTRVSSAITPRCLINVLFTYIYIYSERKNIKKLENIYI